VKNFTQNWEQYSNDLGTNSPSSSIPIGFPKLPEAGSSTHGKIMDEWIRNCDDTHPCLSKTSTFLPTRLLDVGKGFSTVRLVCDTQTHTSVWKYVALSHRWGSGQPFCTLISSLARHQIGIDIADLPKTYQDAIKVSRALDIQYLWIDSLCILQDSVQDWERESKRMELVYSSAYVTIAATSASGPGDGFLKPRPRRESVIMEKHDGSSYLICEGIDDFNQDVDQAGLNQRGWVLQERALSRRTIHFTEKQTYWECGQGVRCETMMKMKK
jgi:hypothetical protein